MSDNTKLIADARKLAAEAKARAEKATPGPWLAKYCANFDKDGNPIRHSIEWRVTPVQRAGSAFIKSENDAMFIEHSRTDVPALADLVDQLAAALEQAQRMNAFLEVKRSNMFELCKQAIAERDRYKAELEEIAAKHDGKSIHGWDDGYAEGCNDCAEIAAAALHPEV